MKKIISLLLVAVLLVAAMAPCAFAAEHPSTVTITYTASGSAFSAFIGDLIYDHELFTLVSVSGVNCSSAENNGDRVIWERGTNVEAPITVLTAVFNVKAGIECGTYTGFGVAVTEALDENLAAVNLSISGNSLVLEHDWVAGEEVKADCENDGYIPYTCSICGATKQETTTKAGHTPAEAVKENVVEADCENAGSYDSVVYCSVCGEELSRDTIIVDATGDDHVLTDSTTGADCKTPGKDTYTCSCGDSYTVDNDKYGPHNFEAVPNQGKHTHNWVCSVCGAVGVENEKCTDSDKDGKCDHCHQDMPKDEPTDPTDPEGGNKTGDVTPYPVFFMIAIAAVMGAAYGFKRKFEI